MEGIETGVGKTLRGKDGHRHQGEEEKDQGEIADQADAADVQVANQGEKGGGNQPMLEAGEWEQFAEVVGHEHAVSGAHEESAGPVPPAAVESPEVTEGSASPAIKAALHRHGGGHFRGGQRDGNAEQKRNYQDEDEGEAGAGGGNHGLEAEGAAGAVSVKHGHEGREGDVLQFAMAWGRGWLRGHGPRKVEEGLFGRQRKIKPQRTLRTMDIGSSFPNENPSHALRARPVRTKCMGPSLALISLRSIRARSG